MDGKKSMNPFQEVHERARVMIDHAREVRDAELRNKDTDAAAFRGGCDQPESKLSPHLVEDGSLKRCSVCKKPFFSDAKPSLNAVFARHVLQHRKPE